MTTSLPTRDQLLRACRGEDTAVHPLAPHARELTDLHNRRLTAEKEAVRDIDAHRTRLVRDIDRWTATHLPSAPGGAYLHTEGIGAIVDRLAQLTALAYNALATVDGWDLWNAWERLAELSLAYEDLAGELTAGRRRLPTPD